MSSAVPGCVVVAPNGFTATVSMKPEDIVNASREKRVSWSEAVEELIDAMQGSARIG